jgi:hexosaminidase
VDLQAFPFIAPHAPELAARGAFSPQERYTSDDIRGVVSCAADLGIRVVIEVDVPGHTASFCKAHPEVCPKPSCGSSNALSPATDATFELIEKVLTDVVDATTDRVIHVGVSAGHPPVLYVGQFRRDLLSYPLS